MTTDESIPMVPLSVELLATPGTYVAGPVEAVRRVALSAGFEVEIGKIPVETPADAERLHVRYSPTVRVAGHDLPPQAVTFACGSYG